MPKTRCTRSKQPLMRPSRCEARCSTSHARSRSACCRRWAMFCRRTCRQPRTIAGPQCARRTPRRTARSAAPRRTPTNFPGARRRAVRSPGNDAACSGCLREIRGRAPDLGERERTQLTQVLSARPWFHAIAPESRCVRARFGGRRRTAGRSMCPRATAPASVRAHHRARGAVAWRQSQAHIAFGERRRLCSGGPRRGLPPPRSDARRPASGRRNVSSVPW